MDAQEADAEEGDAEETDAPTSDATNDVYAHVTAVSVSGSPGAYTFSVSVESADTGCEQFADWWEVASEDGTLLYRRILAHSHTDENGTTDPDAPGNTFTRSGGPVDVASDATVIVRAHMNTVGYVGRVMRGSTAGDFASVDLPDFAPELAEQDPLPTGCAF